jgi:outer membrane protein assembly factor BamB
MGVKVSRAGADWQAAPAWVKKESAINFACPVAVGGSLYGVGPAKNLICVDIKTGRQRWSQIGYLKGSPDNAYAGFIVMGKNILALNDAGQLVMFAADPEAFHEVGTLQVSGKCWCNPAYADGRLYLRDARELLCVKLGD